MTAARQVGQHTLTPITSIPGQPPVYWAAFHGQAPPANTHTLTPISLLHPFQANHLCTGPPEALFGKARNDLCSGRNDLARFQIWSSPEALFVSAGPDWKQARFGLAPHVPGLDQFPTSDASAPIRTQGSGVRLAARRRRGGVRLRTRRWRGSAPTSMVTATSSHSTSALSAAFSPVHIVFFLSLPCSRVCIGARLRGGGALGAEGEGEGEEEEEEEEEHALALLTAAYHLPPLRERVLQAACSSTSLAHQTLEEQQGPEELLQTVAGHCNSGTEKSNYSEEVEEEERALTPWKAKAAALFRQQQQHKTTNSSFFCCCMLLAGNDHANTAYFCPFFTLSL
uniref:Uncharacterized protein n=1 Tax=Oryza brachyantha TaxID=4533 RepID=J3LQ62_ORYBR